jgi:hypothetical protein
MINPDYKADYDAEVDERGTSANEAWDDVNYVDLESDDDFIQKGLAIKEGEDYDTRVSVPLDLPDDVLFELMKQAHERDITLNELMEDVIRAACDEALKDPEAYRRKHAPVIQSHPFPPDSFTEEEAREAVRKSKKKKK